MKQEFFWPIYKQLESEFEELSLYIHIDKKQLSTYSIKIADLILRTVSECENLSKELCKKNSIKFLDKNKKIRTFVNFHEYLERLDDKYRINKKIVTFEYKNAEENFDTGRMPFKKIEIKIGKKNKSSWSWYDAYNSIKHDRIKNYRKANLMNLIDAMAALFLLNVYYKNEQFYEEKPEKAINKINSFSDIFRINYTVKPKYSEEIYTEEFDKIIYKHFQIEKLFSTYIIEFHKEVKTPSDKAQDLMDFLQTSSTLKTNNEKINIDNRSLVKVYAYIHEKE